MCIRFYLHMPQPSYTLYNVSVPSLTFTTLIKSFQVFYKKNSSRKTNALTAIRVHIPFSKFSHVKKYLSSYFSCRDRRLSCLADDNARATAHKSANLQQLRSGRAIAVDNYQLVASVAVCWSLSGDCAQKRKSKFALICVCVASTLLGMVSNCIWRFPLPFPAIFIIYFREANILFYVR